MERRSEPYDLLAREMRARIRRRELTRKEAAAKVGISEATLMTVLAGRRPLPEEYIDGAAKVLAGPTEDVDAARSKLSGASKPRASRTNFARGLETDLRVGYVDWPPFAWHDRTSLRPKGLLPDLLELLFTLMGIRADRVEWHEVPFSKLNQQIEGNHLDLVTGFVLQTVSRMARAEFIKLDMPLAVGANALSRSPNLKSPMPFGEFIEALRRGVQSEDRLSIVVVDSEIADEYFAGILPGAPPPLHPDSRSIQQTIEDAMRYPTTVVIADHVSCVRAAKEDLTGSRRVILDPPIGNFVGGFILPADDPEWAEFFENSIHHLLESQLPGVAQIFTNYAGELEPFIKLADPTGKKLLEWLNKYWPSQKHLLWPQEWCYLPELASEIASLQQTDTKKEKAS